MNNNSGIVKVKEHGTEYIVWTHTHIVRQYIKEYLRKRFPGKLIVRELNKIDLSIPEENLPVEIQATHVIDLHIRYASWEDRIKRQIDQDIIYGKCLFFFDSELFRAMKSASKNMSINMDWFRKLMKDEKLKVFIVSYDGIIDEVEYKDFDFLSNVSQTCKIAAETDDMILNQNKMKIFSGTINKYGFTQDEIDRFDNDHQKYYKDNSKDKNDNIPNDEKAKFLKKQTSQLPRPEGRGLQLGSIERVD